MPRPNLVEKESSREIRPFVFVQVAMVFAVLTAIAHFWPAVSLWYMLIAAVAATFLGYLALTLGIIVWFAAICVIWRDPPSDELVNWFFGVGRRNP